MLRYFYLILVFHISVAVGQEGNYKSENFGNQSVLLNGNVTGSVSDLGLTYYNPARLGLIENPSFTVGGKAFQWSLYDFNNVLESNRSLSSNKFGGLPATIAGTFDLKQFPGHKFAYSILSRQRSEVDLGFDSGLREDLDEEDAILATEQLADVYFKDRVRDDWFGLTWAYPISETLSVGASVFASIYSNDGRGDILLNARTEEDQVITYVNRVDYRQRTYGAQIRLGAAWTLSKVEMGVNVSLPLIAVYKKASFRFKESLSSTAPGNGFITDFNNDDLENRRKTALGIAYGIGYPWKNHTLHFNLDWHASVGAYDRITIPDDALEDLEENPFKEELRPVLNFGMGGEFYVSPSINVIGSFSTDFSASKRSINLFDFVNQSTDEINLIDDLWHFAAGLDLHRPWGNIIVGTSYARSQITVGTAPRIPEESLSVQPRNISTDISYERWRFIIGIEIPIITEKIQGVPIPIK